MNEIILLKLGEMVLKGLNRHEFENRLLNDIRSRLKPLGKFDLSIRQSTVYVEPKTETDMDEVFRRLQHVFGPVAMSRARASAKDVDAIVETAIPYLREAMTGAESFKVESKRSDKRFPMTSIQISQAVGGALHDAYPHVRVDVHNPDLTVYVEIRETAAYVHAGSLPGAGGLPVGSGGRGVTLLSGGIDSPVSSYLMAKRGMALVPVHFFSYPYTSPEAREKVEELARILARYTGRMTLHLVPFTAVQEAIRKNCPENLFTLIMRRFMMRIAQRIALDTGCGAIVTGECLGQVASQTLDAMTVTGQVCTLPVFRPLIGLDKEETVKLARRIGTFDTSVLPYEDCCTVFTPRHPKLRPTVEELEKAETALDCETLIESALAGVEKLVVSGW
ncbi:MAG: tRNA 4-thiouridine(8) synthase ThiI [Oscillospiraceae bacterium]|nr:tRNA 4-thiouridine(8) synthase ThiI [Oscillospiraceae bacterium]